MNPRAIRKIRRKLRGDEHVAHLRGIRKAPSAQSLFVRAQQHGRVTHRVHVPGRHAVACQLGGYDVGRLSA